MIYRKIKYTIAEIKEATLKNNKITEKKLPDIKLKGQANQQKIQKEINKLYPYRSIFIMKIYPMEEKYKLSVEDFIKYGEKYE